MPRLSGIFALPFRRCRVTERGSTDGKGVLHSSHNIIVYLKNHWVLQSALEKSRD